MGRAKKILLGLVAVVVLLTGAAAIAVSTMDVNKYRGQIAELLSKQTGRTVKLSGPIKLALSMHGVGIVVQDASISNPSWASRPQMAGIGRLELGVALLPLLDRQLVVTALNVSNADIQLETNANNQNNWDMRPAKETGAAAAPGKPATGSPVAVRVNELSVRDSQLVLRGKDGKTSIFKVGTLALAPQGRGFAIDFSGEYNGAPVALSLTTGTTDLMADAKWPYEAKVNYGKLDLKAKGMANLGKKIVELDPYDLSAGGTSLHGQMTANFAGARSSLRGTVKGDTLDPADLKPANADAAKAAAQDAAASGGPGRLFSTAPLDLASLRSSDVAIDVDIEKVVLGQMALSQFSSKLSLNQGRLALPFKAALGKNALEGQVTLNASASPAQYNLSLKAPDVELSDLLRTVGAKEFLSGKGDAVVELTGSGNSPHELAGSSNGHIDVTAADGRISSSAAGATAAGLTQILAPGVSSPTLNCLAARFVVTNGVARDNGILADSSASTVAGSGGFSLRDETIDMVLRARPKTVETRGLLPPLRITGGLTSPRFGVDAAGAIQSVAGLLTKKSIDSGVPELAAAPAGQNACVYTLDHKPAPAAQDSSVKDAAGQAGVKAKDLGNQLIKGLFGH